MILKAIKTKKIVPDRESLLEILDRYVPRPSEGSVLAITSKIVSICEGSLASPFPKGRGPLRGERFASEEKLALIKKHSQLYLKPNNPYHISLTITRDLLVPTAGIDESNANGLYVLWPADPQQTANLVREHFVKKFKLEKFGVIITDSHTTPLRWGTTGFALAHSGFAALKNYIGKPDIFGRRLEVTKANVMDGLAAAAVVAMGEGKEQTPLAIISNLPFVEFQKRNPTPAELKKLKIDISKDLYTPLLQSAPWKKGGIAKPNKKF